MKASHVMAVVLAVGATAWVLSGQLGEERPATASVETSAAPGPETAPVRARVADLSSRPYTVELVVTGRTEASRYVALRAETSGQVAEVPVREGGQVEAGQVLVRIDMADRNDRLRRAQALVEQREIEANASAELAQSGWRAETSDAAVRANLQDARAELAAIRLDIARTAIAAPFPGVLDAIDVEVGDVVDVNTEIGTLFDLDPVIVVAAVSEREVGTLRVGLPGRARLITGETVEGTIRFVSKVADAATRTFRIELEVPNPDHRIPAGITADVALPLAEVQAHFVSPSVLGLADDGTLGVKVVDADNVVRFVPVEVVADAADGIWIAGLPDEVTIVSVGHDYVAAGQVVEPIRIEGSAVSGTP